MAPPTALAGLLLALAPAQIPTLGLDEPVVLELGPEESEGATASRTLAYGADFAGTLFVHARGDGWRPRLRIGVPSGESLASLEGAVGSDVSGDSGVSGGAHTPCVVLDVEPGTALRIEVARSSPAGNGRVELLLVAAPESEATRSAVDAAHDAIDEMDRLLAEGRVADVRERLEPEIEELVATPGAERSAAVAGACWDLGIIAHEAGHARAAARAWRFARDHRKRCFPDDHPELQWARGNLAVALLALGDLAGARELQERVLGALERVLPEEDPELCTARGNLATTLRGLDELEAARELEERVLAVRTRTLPEEHPDLQQARANLAVTLHMLGDARAARTLQEQVLLVLSQELPADHPQLQAARENLALSLAHDGDLVEARELQERVLVSREGTLPDGHSDLSKARGNLALVLNVLGDTGAARELEEKVLEVRSATLPDDHPHVQVARMNLAATLSTSGDLAQARALLEHVLAVGPRPLPAGHPYLLRARSNLAAVLDGLGEIQAARELQQDVLARCERSLPEVHPLRLAAQQNLSLTLASLGELEQARDLGEANLRTLSGALPDDHSNLQKARRNLIWTCARIGDRETTLRLAHELAASVRGDVVRWITTSSPRETEMRAGRARRAVSSLVSLALGSGFLEPAPELEVVAFELAESLRGARLTGSRLAGTLDGNEELDALRERARRASVELAHLLGGGAGRDVLAEARRERERVERELLARIGSTPRGEALLVRVDLASLVGALDEDEAVVATWLVSRWSADPADSGRVRSIDVLVAFVVRPDRPLALVDLGPVAPIAEGVARWREAVGEAARGRGVGVEAAARRTSPEGLGEDLRRRVFDPLAPHLEGVQRITVAPDDVLHLVPFDALPLGEGLLGERFEVHVRSTLAELLFASPRRADRGLVALGGPEFGPASGVGSFPPLAGAAEEARGIARLWMAGSYGGSTLLTGADASRDKLLKGAPKARFLHVATHGWFAPDSLRSSADPDPLDRWSGRGSAMIRREQVRDMSPMLLCGLALAEANLPPDALGRVPGRLTAEEIATLDLTGCELAVLSACDSSVGVRRAGQGLASLQRALHMAGARSVITSLWRVSDAATAELMVDFYRRLWVERKPKARALWEAKMALREAGYPERDWAGWVLSGDPD